MQQEDRIEKDISTTYEKLQIHYKESDQLDEAIFFYQKVIEIQPEKSVTLLLKLCS